MMNGLQLTAKTLESTNLKLFWFLDLDLAVNAVNKSTVFIFNFKNTFQTLFASLLVAQLKENFVCLKRMTIFILKRLSYQ